MRVKTSDELQGPTVMASRHGGSENELQRCAQCGHLTREHGLPWVCEMFITPGRREMPWDGGNRACGLFETRT